MEIDDDSNVSKLPVKFRERLPDERTLLSTWEAPEYRGCDHFMAQYIIDEKEADVTCGRCKAKLNPMWVLHQLAVADRRYAENQAAAKAMNARLDERSRTKCQHCKKMTRISRN